MRLLLFVMTVYVNNSFALGCEFSKFSPDIRENRSVVRVRIIDVENYERTQKRIEKLSCMYANNCSFSKQQYKEFFKLYSLAEPDATALVVESFSSEIQDSARIDFLEVDYPVLVVGQEYILTVSPFDIESELYTHNPCAVVPLDSQIEPDGYYFEESPSAILKILHGFKNSMKIN